MSDHVLKMSRRLTDLETVARSLFNDARLKHRFSSESLRMESLRMCDSDDLEFRISHWGTMRHGIVMVKAMAQLFTWQEKLVTDLQNDLDDLLRRMADDLLNPPLGMGVDAEVGPNLRAAAFAADEGDPVAALRLARKATKILAWRAAAEEKRKR